MSFCAYFSRQRPKPAQEPQECIELDGSINDQIKIISDPYKDQFWHGPDELEKLKGSIHFLLEEIISAAKSKTLKEIGKPHFENWMTHLLETCLNKNELYHVYNKLGKMVDVTINNNGWLVYWGW